MSTKHSTQSCSIWNFYPDYKSFPYIEHYRIKHLDSAFLTKQKRKYLMGERIDLITNISFFRNEEVFDGVDHIFPDLNNGKNNRYKLVEFFSETIAFDVFV